MPKVKKMQDGMCSPITLNELFSENLRKPEGFADFRRGPKFF